MGKACDDRANGILASVTGAFGLRDSQLHELLSRFVGRWDHVDGLYPFVARVFQHKRYNRNSSIAEVVMCEAS